MALTRWEPFRELETMREQMDRLMERFFPEFRGREALEAGTMSLPLDIWETPEAINIEASVPGIRPEDLDIRVEGNVLTIRGEMKREREIKEENILRQERRSGRCFRQVSLPATVQAEKAEARFENGVVTITLPKAEAARPKQIPVRTGARREERAA
ncbi:MAG: Hsp20/alpha crystallin family protein [Chloroflexi bacterium]|nr:Hsp20/alpha crystallin family protein [Chloroflexota bacterium]